MPEIVAKGRIDSDGKLHIDDAATFKANLFCYPEHPVIVTVATAAANITANQRNYFYGVVVETLRVFFSAGGEKYDKETIVEFLKDKFLFREKMNPIGNRYIKVPISLSNSDTAMTIEEFTDKKEDIQRWAAQTLNLDIPDPDKDFIYHKKQKHVQISSKSNQD